MPLKAPVYFTLKRWIRQHREKRSSGLPAQPFLEDQKLREGGQIYPERGRRIACQQPCRGGILERKRNRRFHLNQVNAWLEKIFNMQEPKKGVVMLRLPSTLSTYSDGKSQIILQATTLEELLVALAHGHPRIWECLCTPDGHVRPHVKIFVNNALVTSEDDLAIVLNPGQEVIVLPATS